MMKLCARCRIPIEYPKRYCDSCIPEATEQKKQSVSQSNRMYNKNRNPKYIRFYKGDKWRALSQTYMTEQLYTCECCQSIATEVHHIVPIQTDEGWELRYEWTNLMAVCVKCHNKQHKRFNERTYIVV